MMKCLGYLSLAVVFCAQAVYCLTADELSQFSSDVQVFQNLSKQVVLSL